MAVKLGIQPWVQFEFLWHFMKYLRLASLQLYNTALFQRLCLHAQTFSLVQPIVRIRLEVLGPILGAGDGWLNNIAIVPFWLLDSGKKERYNN